MVYNFKHMLRTLGGTALRLAVRDRVMDSAQ
jgi:hypothetical protein